MRRERLTITLKESLVRALDAMVDGSRVRNRSHAVETVLTEVLGSQQIKVLILAGGPGVRFRPLTYELPKAMIPVGGKPLLEHTLDQLRQAHFVDITISVGYLGEKIKAYFGDGSRFGLHISYIDQKGSVPGTAQPLRQPGALSPNTSTLVLYGDVLAHVVYADLIEFHHSQKSTLATMALTSVERVCEWGVARLSGSKIISFEEKPKRATTKSHLVNAGIFVVEPAFGKLIQEGVVRLERDVFPRLAEDGRLAGYAFDGLWYDVSTPTVYAQVLKQKGVGG